MKYLRITLIIFGLLIILLLAGIWIIPWIGDMLILKSTLPTQRIKIANKPVYEIVKSPNQQRIAFYTSDYAKETTSVQIFDLASRTTFTLKDNIPLITPTQLNWSEDELVLFAGRSGLSGRDYPAWHELCIIWKVWPEGTFHEELVENQDQKVLLDCFDKIYETSSMDQPNRRFSPDKAKYFELETLVYPSFSKTYFEKCPPFVYMPYSKCEKYQVVTVKNESTEKSFGRYVQPDISSFPFWDIDSSGVFVNLDSDPSGSYLVKAAIEQ